MKSVLLLQLALLTVGCERSAVEPDSAPPAAVSEAPPKGMSCVSAADGMQRCKLGDMDIKWSPDFISLRQCVQTADFGVCRQSTQSGTNIDLMASVAEFQKNWHPISSSGGAADSGSSRARAAAMVDSQLTGDQLLSDPGIEKGVPPVQRTDTIVRAAARPVHSDMGTLVEEMSIGSANAAGPLMLSLVRELLPLKDGTILVVDAPDVATPIVRQYDSRGNFVRNIGRPGIGPGEYQNPGGVAQLPDGRILLYERGQHRINVYTAAGEPADHWRLTVQRLNCGNCANAISTDTAGLIYYRTPVRPRSSAEPFGGPYGLVRLRQGGTVVDTIFPPSFPTAPPFDTELFRACLNGCRGGRTASLPYRPAGTWTWSPLGYMVTGVSTSYAIDLRIPATAARATAAPPAVWREEHGVTSIRRTVPLATVSDAERAEWRFGVERFLRAEDPRWVWRGPDIPKVKPAFRSVLVGNDGRIWVMPGLPSEPRTPPGGPNAAGREDSDVHYADPPVFDVFEPNATYLGQVRIPAGFNVYVRQGDYAWGTVRDANDVPYVKRWRIVWR